MLQPSLGRVAKICRRDKLSFCGSIKPPYRSKESGAKGWGFPQFSNIDSRN